jgi:hypothetical protein
VQDFDGSGSTWGGALGDFDLDGDLDLFAGHYGGGGNGVWENDGSAFFTDTGIDPVSFGAPYDIKVGDLNGDMKPDVFAASSGANTVFLNDTFLPDTDGDGVPDAVDQCEGEDDALDEDGDTVPDGCDVCLGDDASDDIDGDYLCGAWEPDLAPSYGVSVGEVLPIDVAGPPDTMVYLMVGSDLGATCPVWMAPKCMDILNPHLYQKAMTDGLGQTTFSLDASVWAAPSGSRVMQAGFRAYDGNIYLGEPTTVTID